MENKLENIIDIASKLNLNIDDIDTFGKYKAKINLKPSNKKGKLILVTSINPTPYGEGKTTISIGLNDALRKLNYNSVATLREPSLGPVFGVKGGATGGGYARLEPSTDINLHFNGDFHAITSANNLICSVIDNHIFQGNYLNIDPNRITFNRCLDINDRILRDVKLNNRIDHFDITAASEIMAIFCLSTSLTDLKNKISNIIVGYSFDNNPVYVRDLKCEDSVTILLKDAIKPNLVQSLENNPVIVHGGPFANIAHGCNSLFATNLALGLCDYVVTEAGFGADLGLEKFYDIKSRYDIKPSCVVINFTVRALKHNGLCSKEEINEESLYFVEKGIVNLKAHIDNVKNFTNNIIVCLNKFDTDTDMEIDYIENYLEKFDIPLYVSTSYLEGSKGSINLAKKVIDICNNEVSFNYLYDLNESITSKITKVCTKIYRASNVYFTNDCLEKINYINDLGYSNLPICIAKTQYSLSNDPKLLGVPSNYDITVDKIKLNAGAGFITVYLGDIMTMPGLSKNPNLENMYIDEYEVKGVK